MKDRCSSPLVGYFLKFVSLRAFLESMGLRLLHLIQVIDFDAEQLAFHLCNLFLNRSPLRSNLRRAENNLRWYKRLLFAVAGSKSYWSRWISRPASK
jgi:hypothetical protein